MTKTAGTWILKDAERKGVFCFVNQIGRIDAEEDTNIEPEKGVLNITIFSATPTEEAKSKEDLVKNIIQVLIGCFSKDGEEISEFLALIGANNSVIKFEEIRVLKETRNDINRLVNCETANLNKTINASVKQIEDIKLIQSKNQFNNLPEILKEMAQVRLENPDMPLSELGKQLSKPIGKSGVNHRLKKISAIADEIRKK